MKVLNRDGIDESEHLPPGIINKYYMRNRERNKGVEYNNGGILVIGSGFVYDWLSKHEVSKDDYAIDHVQLWAASTFARLRAIATSRLGYQIMREVVQDRHGDAVYANLSPIDAVKVVFDALKKPYQKNLADKICSNDIYEHQSKKYEWMKTCIGSVRETLDIVGLALDTYLKSCVNDSAARVEVYPKSGHSAPTTQISLGKLHACPARLEGAVEIRSGYAGAGDAR